MKLSIVIPVFNESESIRTLLDRVEKVDLGEIEKEIVIVDDASTDGTREILQNLDSTCKVYFHRKNKGKGAALRTGFDHATGDLVIIQDADLEYDPEDYSKMIEVLVKEDRPILYGSRILEPKNRRHASVAAYTGARLLTFLTNLLYGSKLTDEPTCYKLFRREFLMDLNLKCERFEFCPEVTAKTLRRGIEIKEVPIRYYPRSRAQGKKINWPDFFEAVWVLVRERFAKVPVAAKASNRLG